MNRVLEVNAKHVSDFRRQRLLPGNLVLAIIRSALIHNVYLALITVGATAVKFYPQITRYASQKGGVIFLVDADNHNRVGQLGGRVPRVALGRAKYQQVCPAVLISLERCFFAERGRKDIALENMTRGHKYTVGKNATNDQQQQNYNNNRPLNGAS